MTVVDISRFQRVISLEVFRGWRAAGISRVIVKLGGGDAGRYKDSCHDANAANARAAGLTVEGYWFNGTTDHVADAEFAASIAAPGETIWFDVESEKFATHTMPHWTPQQLDAAARRAADLGHPVGAYMSSSVTFEADWSCCTWMPLWVANYGARSVPNVGHWSGPVMWQHTSTGSLPGYGGHLDLSHELAGMPAAPAASTTGNPFIDQEDDMFVAINTDSNVGALAAPGIFAGIPSDLSGEMQKQLKVVKLSTAAFTFLSSACLAAGRSPVRVYANTKTQQWVVGGPDIWYPIPSGDGGVWTSIFGPQLPIDDDTFLKFRLGFIGK